MILVDKDMLLGKAPMRISFAGGGTDLEEYHSKYDGYSLAYAIDKYTYVMMRFRKDKKFQGFSPDFASHIPPNRHDRVETLQGHEIVLACMKELKFSRGVDTFFCSDVGPGSGLGASSSMTTNMVKVILTIQNKEWSKNKIAMKAYRIGHDVLRWKIGKQDEFAASYGNLNLFKFTKEKVTVEPIILNESSRSELQKHSMLFYLSPRKHSSEILESQIKNINRTNKTTMMALHKVKSLALEMRDALKNNDLTKFADIINKGWEEKKKYAAGVTNASIDKAAKLALSHGADALKVTGAGGGGHLFVYADPSKQSGIEKSLKKHGIFKVDFKYQSIGATVFDLHNL